MRRRRADCRLSMILFVRDSVSRTVKAKFHYASCFEAASKLVADRFEAGRRPSSNLSAISFKRASVMKFGFNFNNLYVRVASFIIML